MNILNAVEFDIHGNCLAMSIMIFISAPYAMDFKF